MKRSFYASLVCLALGAALAVSHFATEVTARCRSTFKAVGHWLETFALDAVATIAGTQPTQERPAVRLVQAKAFMQRLVRRDRPQVTNSWRMIPSV